MHRLFLILLSFFILLSLNSHAEDDVQNTSNLAHFTVHLDKATQNIANIQTVRLTSHQLNPEIQHVATLVNLDPLIIARKDYITVLSNEKIAQFHYLFNQKNVQRALNLQQNNALSTRKLHAQQLQLNITKAQFAEAQQQSDNLRLLIKTQWGNVISDWILNPKNKIFAELSSQQKQLYLIYLPLDTHPVVNTIFLHPFAQRENAVSAHLVSYAPLNNQIPTNKPAFYYLTETSFNASAQRITAWVPTQANKIVGVKIPNTAIVWHLGQAFVYVQQDDETFRRISIKHKQLIDTQHYFIQNELQQGDALVIHGAQMLLSEEFRYQIPAEDDDDD